MDSREDSVTKRTTHTHTHQPLDPSYSTTSPTDNTLEREKGIEREKRVGGKRADISLVKRKRTFPYEYNLILSCFRDATNLWTR